MRESYMLGSPLQTVQRIDHYLRTWQIHLLTPSIYISIHKQNTFSRWISPKYILVSWKFDSTTKHNYLFTGSPHSFTSALLSCVQLLKAFNCFIMGFHQTPQAPAPRHRKWDAQHLLLSTFWLVLLKSCPCSLQKLFTSISKVSIASRICGL